jgi:hypothetical protein
MHRSMPRSPTAANSVTTRVLTDVEVLLALYNEAITRINQHSGSDLPQANITDPANIRSVEIAIIQAKINALYSRRLGCINRAADSVQSKFELTTVDAIIAIEARKLAQTTAEITDAENRITETRMALAAFAELNLTSDFGNPNIFISTLTLGEPATTIELNVNLVNFDGGEFSATAFDKLYGENAAATAIANAEAKNASVFEALHIATVDGDGSAEEFSSPDMAGSATPGSPDGARSPSKKPRGSIMGRLLTPTPPITLFSRRPSSPDRAVPLSPGQQSLGSPGYLGFSGAGLRTSFQGSAFSGFESCWHICTAKQGTNSWA